MEFFLVLLSSFFKSIGFKKSGNIWYSKCSEKLEGIILFEYQSSRNQDGFYINVGIYFPDLHLEKKKLPRSWEWTLRGRHNSFLNHNNSLIPKYSNEESAVKEIELLKSEFQNIILPYLLNLLDTKFLISELTSGKLKLSVQRILVNDLINFLQSKQ